jgi:DNA uptake protein ComE-like DNA-binding protein
MALTKILLTSVLSMLLAGTAFAQVGNNTSLLNPNLAGREELVALPQLDEALVDAILDERPFLDMSELHALLSQSLSDAQLAALYAQAFIPINLNTATREAILSIPSVGDRLAREFEEYRPYKAIAQFRRELGKYVSDEEVARFEQYVFVPLNLNTATPEDLLTIPGVGNRLLREFLEYRPYISMQQFRREIGKYVSDEEITRLERYVTLD